MILNGQTVGGLTMNCVVCVHLMILNMQTDSVSFKTTVDDFDCSDSRKVHCGTV